MPGISPDTRNLNNRYSPIKKAIYTGVLTGIISLCQEMIGEGPWLDNRNRTTQNSTVSVLEYFKSRMSIALGI